MIYSDKVMDHFQNPRNVGVLKDADGQGQVGNPVCGDMMTFYIKVKDDRLTDIKFQTFGCGAAIAVSSIVSEMALGKTLDEAMTITNEMVAESLGGLPKNKLHCSNLGADALHAAIEDYRKKETVAKGGPAAETAAKPGCYCPFCEGRMGAEEFCEHCQIEFEDCPHCGNLAKKGAEKCPSCGADLPRP